MHAHQQKENNKTLLQRVDEERIQANGLLCNESRGKKGQFMTPCGVAQLIASKFNNLNGDISILDAGAGVGSLTAALVSRAIRDFDTSSITINAWEIESKLVESFEKNMQLCQEEALANNIPLKSKVFEEDFLNAAVNIIKARKDGDSTPRFNKAILNPPYLKISASSRERKLLRSVGVETGNLYSCFVSLALMLLEEGGELVAITPRSFCNGPYFSDFRRVLLGGNNLEKLHVFESRTKAFKGDKVLQENIIFHITKARQQGGVRITSSTCENDDHPQTRVAGFDEVVSAVDPDKFIHIITNDIEAQIARRIGGMPCSLEDLGISVSTGKVVDFRTRENLRYSAEENTVPLIYPLHFEKGQINWPIQQSKKPNSIEKNEGTQNQLIPNGIYVLTKRISAKEERRRIVAALYTPDIANVEFVAFENKTNYFHSNGMPLTHNFAKGLNAYLNCTQVDQYFRQFNGHTQVNATDLRTLRYPTRETLEQIGRNLAFYEQSEIDSVVTRFTRGPLPPIAE